MEYTVVTSKQLERLKKAVNKRIAEDWAPRGGIACGPGPTEGDMLWAQAMMRDGALLQWKVAAKKRSELLTGNGASGES